MSTQAKRTLARTTLSSRRDLLRALGLAGGVALLAPRGSSTAYAALAPGGYAGNRYLIELDGSVTPAESVEGGTAVGDVAADPATDPVLRKHIGAIHYEDLVLQLNLGAISPQLMSWVAASLTSGGVPKTGTVVCTDYDYKEVRRLEFRNAVITEVALPACDASTPASGALTLRLAPETTQLSGGTGTTKSGVAFTKSKQINTSMFRMNVQGLENACSRIRKVSAASAKRPLIRQPMGGKEGLARPGLVKLATGPLDCASLSVVLPETYAGPFFNWYNDFVLRGNASAELPGRLEFMAQDMRSALVTVDFGNLGITRYAPLSAAEPGSASASTLGLVQVDMFCETINVTASA